MAVWGERIVAVVEAEGDVEEEEEVKKGVDGDGMAVVVHQ